MARGAPPLKGFKPLFGDDINGSEINIIIGFLDSSHGISIPKGIVAQISSNHLKM